MTFSVPLGAPRPTPASTRLPGHAQNKQENRTLAIRSYIVQQHVDVIAFWPVIAVAALVLS
jgi:hypothetical protein